MKNSRKFLERMNELDDELIVRADEAIIVNKKSDSKKRLIIIAAAILAVCAISATVAVLHFRGQSQDGKGTDEYGDVIHSPISDVYWVDTRARNDKQSLIQNSAIVWPWNCRDVYNQYTEVSINGKKYRSRSSYYGGEVLANQIGKKISDAKVKGYDDIGSLNANKEIYHTKECEVFEINGVDSNRILAVKYEGYDGYYAFMNDNQQAPATLGELIDALDLTNNIKLNSFYYDENQDHRDEHYALSNEISAKLWEILKECSSAPIGSDEDYRNSYNSTREVSFAISSSTLGVYNLSFSFTDEGYLRTNIENYGYSYNIGREAASKIIGLALKNMQVILISEKQYLVGTVTEIGEDYIKINDSALMKNAEEGIEFTVYATNMNIRRYIISGYLKVGDTVQVTHGYLLKNSYTKIENAIDLQECIITSAGNVLIPE